MLSKGLSCQPPFHLQDMKTRATVSGIQLTGRNDELRMKVLPHTLLFIPPVLQVHLFRSLFVPPNMFNLKLILMKVRAVSSCGHSKYLTLIFNGNLQKGADEEGDDNYRKGVNKLDANKYFI